MACSDAYENPVPGLGPNTLKAGIELQVDRSGHSTSRAWYQWYVEPPRVDGDTPVDLEGYPLDWVGENGMYQYVYRTTIDNFPVTPGDSVICFVQHLPPDQGYYNAGVINFGNETTGQYIALTLAAPPPAGETNPPQVFVEWGIYAGVALPNFGSVTFSDALACSPAEIGDPSQAGSAEIENGSGTVLTQTTTSVDAVTITFIG